MILIESHSPAVGDPERQGVTGTFESAFRLDGEWLGNAALTLVSNAFPELPPARRDLTAPRPTEDGRSSRDGKRRESPEGN